MRGATSRTKTGAGDEEVVKSKQVVRIEAAEIAKISRTDVVLSDDELARRVHDGDGAAWDTLVRRHGQKVFGLCWRSTGNMAGAEDVVQETWLRLWRTRDKIYDGGFVGRVFAIARNLCISRARSGQGCPEVPLEREAIGSGSDVDDIYIEVTEDANMREVAEDLLSVVTAKERRILMMLIVDEMTLMQAAEAEGCSHTSIAQIRNRALKKIRAHSSRGSAL